MAVAVNGMQSPMHAQPALVPVMSCPAASVDFRAENILCAKAAASEALVLQACWEHAAMCGGP